MRVFEKVFGDEYATRIVVGEGSVSVLGRECAGIAGAGRVLLVYDERVPRDFVGAAQRSLAEHGLEAIVVGVEGGEGLKSLDRLVWLWRLMLSKGVDRGSLVVAVGGGSVSDLVGFAAATFMRGVDWVVVPTTMLSMVDACVGGKTGINLDGKNIVGAFHHPRLVVVDTSVVMGLPEAVYLDGFAEVVKHGVIDGGFFYWLRGRVGAIVAREPRVVEEAISRSLEVKLGIVARDPRERRGDRLLLNLGHTVGHAVERASGYSVSHGRAVALGLLAEALASHMLGLAAEDVYGELRGVLEQLGLVECPRGVPADAVAHSVVFDKKRRGSSIMVPVAHRIGDVVVHEIGLESYRSVVRRAWVGVCGDSSS